MLVCNLFESMIAYICLNVCDKKQDKIKAHVLSQKWVGETSTESEQSFRLIYTGPLSGGQKQLVGINGTLRVKSTCHPVTEPSVGGLIRAQA